MAEVYKVKTVGIAGFEKVQALKRILPSLARQPRFIRSFVDEARIAVLLNHRNIVQVFDFGKVGGELFLSMELIDGIDLKTALGDAKKRNMRLPFELACYIAGEVGHGLDYAHNKSDTYGEPLRIVHCDVSPQNVMISYEGYVKILDFGVARAAIGTQEWTRRLRGKPRYMAPEQTRGDQPSAETDVFALGIVTWEMLTGRPLFEGRDLQSLLQAVRRVDAAPARKLNPAVPGEVSDVVSRALNRERTDRGTAGDLYMTLQRAAQIATPQGNARALAQWLAKVYPPDDKPVPPPRASIASVMPGPPKPQPTRMPRPIAQPVRSPAPSPATVPAMPPRRAPAPSRPAPVQVARDSRPSPPSNPSQQGMVAKRKFVRTVPRTVLEENRKSAVSRNDAVPLPGTRAPAETQPDALTAAPRLSPEMLHAAAGETLPSMSAADIDSMQDMHTEEYSSLPAALRAAGNVIDSHLEQRVTVPFEAVAPPGALADGSDDATAGFPTGSTDTAVELDRDFGAPTQTLDISAMPELLGDVTDPRRTTEPSSGSDDDHDDHGDHDDVETNAFPPVRTGTMERESSAFMKSVTTTVVLEREDRIQDIDEEPDAMPESLMEKRRVVAAAVLVDGEAEARAEQLRILGDLAYKCGAVIHEHDERSALVVFGLEVAGEDDVAKAMAFALDAIETARETNSALGSNLNLRIAARAGIVATPAGEDERGYRLVGDAVAETRELARNAEPGRALLAGGAGRLTSAYYAFREVPVRRHRRRRLRVLELLGARSFDERNRALHARIGRFVGRFREIAQLAQALAIADRDGRRVTLALIGPPGVGKSRLISEFVARAENAPRGVRKPRVIAVASMPGAKSSPFALFMDLMQALLGLPPERGEAARGRLSRRARRVLEKTDMPAEDIDEIVRAVETATELRDGMMMTRLHTSTDLRQRVLGMLHALTEALRPKDGRPVVTIVEDLHLADKTSVELLRENLTEESSRPELTILTTSADSPVADDLDEWVDDEIELGELSEDEVDELIEDRLADTATEARILAIAQRAGGNPLFIEQLATEARDGGEIPPTVRAVVTARVDRLPATAKAVLQYAAVAGYSFRASILEELMDRETVNDLTELCDERLLEHDEYAGGDVQGGLLRFSAELTREVVYESLSAKARRETHRALGTLLSTRHRAGCDEPPATIAEHLELGGMAPQASAYWLRAGRVALAAGDAIEAVEHFSGTLDIERKRSEESRSGASKNRLLGALLGREQANRQIGDADAQRADLESLQELARSDSEILADVQNRVALLNIRTGDFRAAVAASEAAEMAARSCLDELTMAEALRIRGEAFELMGEYETALSMTEQAQEIFQRNGALYEETTAMIGIGRNHLFGARYEQALEAYSAIIRRVENMGDPWLERVVRNHIAIIHWCLGEYEDAMKSAKRSVAICRRYADRAREGDSLTVCGTVLFDIGRYREARVYFTRALGILEHTQSRWSLADCLVSAGVTEWALGDRGRGLDMLLEAEGLARDIGAKYVLCNALNARAGVLLQRARQSDLDAAQRAAEVACEVAREAKLIGAEILALSRFALAQLENGAHDWASEHIDQAVHLLERQRYIEGQEQEIFYTQYRIGRAVGHPKANKYLERARQELRRKLDMMGATEWRQSFTENVRVNVDILEAVRRLG